MRAFVTGGAGFVGSNLVGLLIDRGFSVTVYDNLLLGRREFLAPYEDAPGFRFVEADLLNTERLDAELQADTDVVFHLAANSDISHGASVTDVDLQLGTIATYNVLEAMRLKGIDKLVFASTSAIYGEADVLPTPETYGPLLPISFYGASKLACEGLIAAFAHNYDIQAWMCRFGNVIGDNGTHGALFDFLTRLMEDPTRLQILGDGQQAKPYLYVRDLIAGMLYIFDNATEQVNFFNLACEGASSVTTIGQEAIAALGLQNVEIEYTGGARGWRGDVPQVRLSTQKLADLGWTTTYDSDGAVRVAAQALAAQMQAEAGGVAVGTGN